MTGKRSQASLGLMTPWADQRSWPWLLNGGMTEFWMVEAEAAFFTLDDIMELAESLVRTVVLRVLERQEPQLRLLERDIAPLQEVAEPFPRLSYTQTLERLQQQGKDLAWGEDLGGDEETVVSQWFPRPVLVHRYPKEAKAFYMEPDPEIPRLALCVDMLAPEGYGEIVGGSQRLNDLDALLARIREHHLPQEPLEWYLDLRRYGSVPHSGFGMGIERLVAWLCGLHHVPGDHPLSPPPQPDLPLSRPGYPARSVLMNPAWLDLMAGHSQTRRAPKIWCSAPRAAPGRLHPDDA